MLPHILSLVVIFKMLVVWALQLTFWIWCVPHRVQ